jgi:hypothetical protein
MGKFKAFFCLAALCIGISPLLTGCGPSAAEVDATQDAQCTRWGAARGSSDYIQCRATLAVNYQREQRDDDNATAAGVAIGLAAGANGAVKR